MSTIIDAVESLLCDLHPELRERRELVPESEIARLEAIFPLPLPPFYRWFLARFGRDKRPLRYPLIDFSIDGLLAAHEEELPDPDEEPEEYAVARVQDPRWCMIGYSLNPPMPSLYYDLNHPMRDDARVTLGGRPWADTFYEFLLWGQCHEYYLSRFAQRRAGTVRCESGNVAEKMATFLQSWGFTPMIPTGTRMMLLTAKDAAVLWSKGFENDTTLKFELATDAPVLGKRLFGELAMSDELVLLGPGGRSAS